MLIDRHVPHLQRLSQVTESEVILGVLIFWKNHPGQADWH